jgi:hypothetical protein
MADRDSARLVGRERVILGVMFALSAIGFAYQVLLTRLFSLIFQYHYVFLIVSVAIAGMSVGAALAVRGKKGKRAANWTTLTFAALALALSLPVIAIILSLLRSASLMGVMIALAVLPFAIIGYLNAALFTSFARSSPILYAADLLGGSVGLVAGLLAIGWLGAFDAIIGLGLLAAGVAFVLAWLSCQAVLRRLAAGVAAIILVGLVGNRVSGVVAFDPAALADAPPDKTMMYVLQEPQSSVIRTRWDPFARVDVVKTGDDSFRYLFTDAGAGSIMYRYDGDDSKVSFLRQDVAYLPFAVEPQQTGRVLVLGAGAGRDVLMARLAGAQAITAVEINPTLVDLTRAYNSYNGSIFDLPNVKTVVTDGRNYIERTDERYDLIYANIVYSQAATPGTSALAESYIFTREALRTYWNHLTGSGRIGFVAHHGIEGLRLIVGALDMLRGEGMTVSDALRHVALVSLKSDDAQSRTSVVMILRQPWTVETANQFADQTRQANAAPLYLPLVQDQGFDAMAAGLESLDQYIEKTKDFNFTPSTDDTPFFFQFNRGLPEGLADLLFVSLLIVFVYFSWLIFFFVRRDGQHWKRVSLAPYFGILGVAFLLVEIPLTQRFNLLLGQPVLSLVAVVGGLVIGSGLGSLFSIRFSVVSLPRRVPVFALVVAAAILLSLPIYSAVVRLVLPLDLPLRFLIAAVVVLPLGFVMGVPFPSGLRIADQADPQGLAAFWGANAVTSVLGAALAMIIAMNLGFAGSLVVAAILYGLVAALAYATWPRLSAN